LRRSLLGMIIILLVFALLLFTQNLYLTNAFSSKSYVNAYVSDEIYYVTSSRYVLYKVFNVNELKISPSNNDRYYTIVLGNYLNLSAFKFIRDKCDCFDIIDNNYRGSIPATITISKESTLITRTVFVGNNINAVYIKVHENCSIKRIIEVFEEYNYTIIDVVPGWALPDTKYYAGFNLEHPPLGKYIIMVFILLLGDNPFTWRVPSIVADLITMVFSYLITKSILETLINKKKAEYIALLTPLIMLCDNIYYTIGVLAMLDPFLSMFTVIGVYIFINTNYRNFYQNILKTITFGLAGLIKYSGLFIALADIIEGFMVGKGFIERLRLGFSALLRYYIIYPSMLIVSSLPFIIYLGFYNWFKMAIIDAIRWHLSTKTPPGAGPVSSSPFDWLIGVNSFILWTDPVTGKNITCTGLWYVYLSSMILALIILPLYFRQTKIRRLFLASFSIWFMYLLLYLLGNKSLYSFYIIHFVPLLEIQLIVIISILLLRVKKIYNK